MINIRYVYVYMHTPFLVAFKSCTSNIIVMVGGNLSRLKDQQWWDSSPIIACLTSMPHSRNQLPAFENVSHLKKKGWPTVCMTTDRIRKCHITHGFPEKSLKKKISNIHHPGEDNIKLWLSAFRLSAGFWRSPLATIQKHMENRHPTTQLSRELSLFNLYEKDK